MADINHNTTTSQIESGTGSITLDPAGTETVTISNGLMLPDGTKTAPAVRFTDDDNTGLYSPTNDITAITGHGEDIVRFNGVASSVNYVDITSSATGNSVLIASAGTDTNISLSLTPKGTGDLTLDGLKWPQADGTAGYVIKTDGAGQLSFVAQGGGGSSPLTTKGDLYTYDTGDQRLAIGTNDQVLTADSTEATGMKWATAAGGGGASVLDDLTDVSLVQATAARYWKISFSEGWGGTNCRISNIDMRETVGGTDVCSGGTVTGTGGGTYANAFDASQTSWWQLNPNSGTITYDFGSGNDKTIVEYHMKSFTGTWGPKSWKLEYSSDNTNWTISHVVTGFPDMTSQVDYFFDTAPQKGSILGFNGTTWDDLRVGADDTILMADSSTPYGVTWGGVPAPSGLSVGITTEPAGTGSARVVIGNGTSASTHATAVVIGNNSSATGSQSVAVGDGATAALQSVALGLYGTASGGNSFAVGYYATASATGSLAIGPLAEANHYGERVEATGCFGWRTQDAQTIHYLMRYQTTTATPADLGMYALNSLTPTEKALLDSDSTYLFTAKIVARRTDADGESAAYKIEGCVDNNAGTTALVGTPIVTIIAEDTAGWDVSATADNTNDALTITVTGEGSKTIRWFCDLEMQKALG